jgi:ATP-dependent protease ClpP protease subunit
MKEAWIRFSVPVDAKSTLQLLKTIDDIRSNDCKKITLLIASSGGDVVSGISIYNYIKMLDIEIDTYNLGNVDSIAVTLYCVGKNRYCPHCAGFTVHDVTWDFSGSFGLKSEQVMERANFMIKNRCNIAEIIASTVNKKKETILKDMEKGLILDPKEAVKYNLVTEIKELKIPEGSKVYAIDEYIEPAAVIRVQNTSVVTCAKPYVFY